MSWSPSRKAFLLSSLYNFAKYGMGYADMTPRTHGPMCEFVDSLLAPHPGRQEKGMVLVPRVCFKTSAITISAPPYFTEKYNPSARTLIDSHVWGYSHQILDEIKERISVEEFVRTFGAWRSPELQWNEDGIIYAGRTVAHKEPTIDTSGLDKDKTGGHYDLIIGDDWHTAKNSLVVSTIPMHKIRHHVQTLYPILEPDGTLVAIGTRWSHNDTYGWVLKRDEKRVREGRAPEYKTFIRKAYNPDGTLFFPEKLSEAFLEEQRYNLEDRLYSVWYLNEPIEEGSKVFPLAYLRFYTGDFVDDYTPHLVIKDQQVPVYVTMAIDPAFTDKRRSDFTGFTIVGQSDTGEWYVLWAEAFKGLPDQMIERAVYLARRFMPKALSVETIAAQVLLKGTLSRRFRDAGLNIPIHEYKSGRAKDARIQAMQPMFKAGRVHIMEGQEELVRQLTEYPQLEHEDVLDSLAQHADITRKSRPMTLAPVDDPEEEWDAPQKPGVKLDGTHAGLGSM